MLGFYNYTVIATYLGLCSGVYGITRCFAGRNDLAILCLMVAGFFDTFDGAIARTKKNRTPEECRFGIQIDSLTDLVAFGVLPALIGYTELKSGGMDYSSVIIALVYSLTALIRLAYYNVTEEIRQSETAEKRHYYQGLPVTTSAALVPFLWCFKPLLGLHFPVVTAVVLFLIAALFISPLKIPKPGGRMLAAVVVAGAGIFAILLDEFFRGLL